MDDDLVSPFFRISEKRLRLSVLSVDGKLEHIMPTVLRVGPFSFVFFSSDIGEPAHIHVKRDRSVVKYWLEPVALAKNRGFAEHELNAIESLVNENRQTLLEAWHDFFGA